MFKNSWEKVSVTYQLPGGMVERMIHLAYPDKKLTSFELIAGGCANLNYKIQLENVNQPLILRLYLRSKAAAYREQKLATFIKKTVPVPLTYYIGELAGYHFAITEFMPGMPLRDLLLGDVPYDLNAIMHAVGMTLSSIASHSFLETGFLDKALRVMPYPCNDILKCAKDCLSHETVLSVLTADSILAISTILEQYSYLWSRSSQGFCLAGKHLVHGDFDPANILVNKVKDVWKVSAILDWEFAFSGSYLWDIASMLRYAHKMPPVFQTSFINALKESSIDLPDTWSSTIHLLNLCSFLDCLKRSDFKHHPHRCFDIRELITFIVLELKSHE